MTTALTKQQRAVLAAIPRWEVCSPVQLAERIGTSKEGAATTASSLVRKGLLHRVTYGGHVRYGHGVTP